MFAFKVVVSTIIVFMLCLFVYSLVNQEKDSGKFMCWAIIVIYILCFMAIWGG